MTYNRRVWTITSTPWPHCTTASGKAPPVQHRCAAVTSRNPAIDRGCLASASAYFSFLRKFINFILWKCEAKWAYFILKWAVESWHGASTSCRSNVTSLRADCCSLSCQSKCFRLTWPMVSQAPCHKASQMYMSYPKRAHAGTAKYFSRSVCESKTNALPILTYFNW